MSNDPDHGPHGPDCNCDEAYSEQQREAAAAVSNADAFALVALEDEGDGAACQLIRSYDPSAFDDPEALMGINLMMNDQLEDLIVEPNVGAVGVTPQQAAAMGLLDAEDMFETESTDTPDNDDFDGVDIDIE